MKCFMCKGSVSVIRVYLDNCCFNRPYDEQALLKVRLETQSKMSIQQCILDGKLELAWSFILEYENDKNPFIERQRQIEKWQHIAVVDCILSDEILNKSKELMPLGLREKDSYHVASAIFSNADYFITTDAKILNKDIREIKVISPVDFVYLVEGTI